ncbi:MAG: cytochrome P450 [Pseudomonadales bacterium]|nr:cytochrome P450 [Pseudomonadales bacterium]
MTESTATELKQPPKVSGEKPDSGHMEEFNVNFARFLMRCNAECGELAEFNMGGQQTILMSGPEAQEAFLKTLDKKLSRAASYKATVPVFGEGVIFDAPPDRMKTQLKIQVDALRYQNMKNYASVIAEEVEQWVSGWGDEGELDFVDEFIQLTLHTACHCLLGKDFRERMTEEFKNLYHDLEKGLQAIAFVDPYMQQPVFEARDAARARLQELISEIIADRRANSDVEYGDALETFMSGTYKDSTHLTDNEVTGLVIATMFAGHHTSSGTAAWALIEFAKNPEYTAEVLEELTELFKDGQELTFEALREIPKLERFVEEVLRLHPPLILLMRQLLEDVDYNGTLLEAGKTVAISTYGSHRNPGYFPDPEVFNPHREKPDTLWAYIPFGGGPHKCAGNAFAMMQLKSIFAALLPRYDFELVDAPEAYDDDLSAMVLKPTSPSRIRYKRRK